MCENDPISGLPVIEMIPGITTQVTGRVSSVRCDLPNKRGKRGKMGKRTADGEWKHPRSKRVSGDESKTQSKTNEVELFAETEVIWGVDVGTLKPYSIDANGCSDSFSSLQQRFITSRFSSSITIPTKSLLITFQSTASSFISTPWSIRYVYRPFHTTPRTITSTFLSSHLDITIILFTFQFSYEPLIHKFPKSIS